MPDDRSVPTGGDDVTFDAFMSYSHGDDRIAQSVQDGLQKLAKPWYKRRALHVFRDTSALSANPDLWAAISTALADARFFILVASRASAASEWVGREIEQWLDTKSARQMLIVLTDGDIEWVRQAGDFDWDRSTALHPALRGAFDQEPLYLDLRWAHDVPELSLRLTRFRDCVADLAAPIHGKAKDDLEGDDLREQRKLRRVARA
ncbi:MAG TPA: toll/interleukin-1 receptor domain-containing protein, partial [Acidimicrobiia bacterium]|nr:toll/interleukin-1 receptor domain-containing protein [Acidimicrobiia bacterium]